MRSSTRPTVPTTMCPPARSCDCWVRIGAPPKTATTSTPLRSPNVRIACVTWMHSSRVGVSTSAWTSCSLGVDVLDHRQPEGRRLARAGLRLADHVAALEQRRDALLLDRARLLVADVVHGLEGLFGEAEVGE